MHKCLINHNPTKTKQRLLVLIYNVTDIDKTCKTRQYLFDNKSSNQYLEVCDGKATDF